ncbi:MAG: aminotransferase class V-fold PLP-dependent enzyme [Pseudomonadota bacterium]
MGVLFPPAGDTASIRTDFSVPTDIHYFNMSYMAPRWYSVKAAAMDALTETASPWTMTSDDFFSGVEALRHSFAKLINASADDIAIMPAVSYGIETATRNLSISRGQTILTLDDQFPSNIYPWHRLATQQNASLKTVRCPQQGDWTEALLDAITEETAIISIPQVHWSDGRSISLKTIGAKARSSGAHLVVDATQSLGAVPLDVEVIKPDFLMAACYKWLLGPYNLCLCYIAPRHQGGEPLEENWVNRKHAADFTRLTDYHDDYAPGARRFDMGERNSPLHIPMMIAALDALHAWTPQTINETIAAQWARWLPAFEKEGFRAPPVASRAGHMLGLHAHRRATADDVAALKEKNIFLSARSGALRISPYLFTSDEDWSALLSALVAHFQN